MGDEDEISEEALPPPPQQQSHAHAAEASPARSSYCSDDEVRKRDSGGVRRSGLPLYLFLRDGALGDTAKVDPRCPNAANPFHVCMDHCLAKITEAPRADGRRSPKSFFSFNSHPSYSSDGDNSMSQSDDNKLAFKCPNASNPYHECTEHCCNKNSLEMSTTSGRSVGNDGKSKKKEINNEEKRSSGRSTVSSSHSWKVDPRCPHASNPYHICAQYCFDYLNEMQQVIKSGPKKGKASPAVASRADVHPECVNSSNPFHKCTDNCFRGDG